MRAIILAAGMGTRLRPITFDIPKSLVPVNKKPMLEKQIEFLKEKGIDDIIIVTGYLHNKFTYLEDKYNVKLVYNNQYNKFNNIYTMYLVRNYFKEGAYVIEADIHLTKNVFLKNPKYSFYMSAKKPYFKKEWVFNVDVNGKIQDINVKDGNDQYIMCGVSYWTKKDASIIVSKLEEIISNDGFNKDLFWDDAVKATIKSLNLYLEPLKTDDIYEIDSLDEWQDIQTKLDKPSVASFMSSFSLFNKLHSNMLEKNRHQDSKMQEAYDKRFGLVIK